MDRHGTVLRQATQVRGKKILHCSRSFEVVSQQWQRIQEALAVEQTKKPPKLGKAFGSVAIKIKESKKNGKNNFPGRRESRKSTFLFSPNCRKSTFGVLGTSKNQLFAFWELQKINFWRFGNFKQSTFGVLGTSKNQLLAFWELQKINFLRFVRCKKSRALQHEDILKETVLKAR